MGGILLLSRDRKIFTISFTKEGNDFSAEEFVIFKIVLDLSRD